MKNPESKSSLPPRAELLAEFEIGENALVLGVTHDGSRIWVVDAESKQLVALDPDSGATLERITEIRAEAGTAYDGEFLWQIGEGRIHKIDPRNRTVLGSIPVPDPPNASGLAWAEGALWVGQTTTQKILKIDPETGETLKTLRTDRLVTGVCWHGDELYQGALVHFEDPARDMEIRRLDPETGETKATFRMPEGKICTGIDTDDRGRFWCGGGEQGRLRAIRLPDDH